MRALSDLERQTVSGGEDSAVEVFTCFIVAVVVFAGYMVIIGD